MPPLPNHPNVHVFYAESGRGKAGEAESSSLRSIRAIWKGQTQNGEEKPSIRLDAIPVN